MSHPPAGKQKVVLVTGPAGAGRSTAIKALEDLGHEAIDNLPITLVPRLLDGPVLTRPLALGIDSRGRGFTPEALIALCDTLAARPDVVPELLYLDCAPDVLARRYSETRRRHPLSPDAPPDTGIAQDTALLAPVRSRADILIDSTDLTPHDLRARVHAMFGDPSGPLMSVQVVSFSYKRGLPAMADLVFDTRFLDNPHWTAALRDLTGLDPAVADKVRADEHFAPQIGGFRDALVNLMPLYRREGKSHLTVAFGCTGGQHRSVAVAEYMAAALAEAGWPVSTVHRELERRGLADRPALRPATSGERP